MEVQFPNHICRFCGQLMEECWDEYTKYHECNCKDAKLNREISRKIQELESDRPQPKFKIKQTYVVVKI